MIEYSKYDKTLKDQLNFELMAKLVTDRYKENIKKMKMKLDPTSICMRSKDIITAKNLQSVRKEEDKFILKFKDVTVEEDFKFEIQEDELTNFKIKDFLDDEISY